MHVNLVAPVLKRRGFYHWQLIIGYLAVLAFLPLVLGL
jgi:hypothetical protein